jgi:hypothetical protein
MIRGLVALSLAISGAACRFPEPMPPVNPLVLPESSPVWTDETLLKRIGKSPHDYFRFVNIAFAGEVCRIFETVMPVLPTVNLHGDAHLEQIAVTSTGFGLADFDDSASGPPVIDLVRFRVSIEIALRQLGWEAHSAEVQESFMQAYRLGLSDNPEAPPIPAAVARIRSDFETNIGSFLEAAESRMLPVSGPEKEEAEEGYARYVELMLRIHPSWTESMLGLKRWGFLSQEGIGSATTRRYLARIEGRSADPDDDVILEAKELRDISGVPCVVAQRGGALRVIAGAVRFGQQSDPYLAIIPRGSEEAADDPPWWVQSWHPTYTELDVDSSLESVTELKTVVETAGFQMARGHTNLLPPPFDRQLCELVRVMLGERQLDIRSAVAELTRLTLAAHQELNELEDS